MDAKESALQQKQQFIHQLGGHRQDRLVSINAAAMSTLSIPTEAQLATQEGLPYICSGAVDAVWFAIVFNSINHQYWDLRPDGTFIRYRFNGRTGALAALTNLRLLLDRFDSMEEARSGLEAHPELFSEHFGDLTGLPQRFSALLQALGPNGLLASETLLQTALEDGILGIEQALMLDSFLPKGFQDPFLKKAQLVLHMAASYLTDFDIQTQAITTCYADYQIPKVLRGLGVLEYSPELAQCVDTQILIPQDGVMENALRFATILACEQIAQHHQVDVPLLDFWLWGLRNTFSAPFHLTQTTRY